jgi:hypothetical protein
MKEKRFETTRENRFETTRQGKAVSHEQRNAETRFVGERLCLVHGRDGVAFLGYGCERSAEAATRHYLKITVSP